MAEQQIDLVPGRLTGYRKWKIVGDGNDGNPFRLRSITASTIWPWTPEIRAVCKRSEVGWRVPKFATAVAHDPEDVPNAECSCGIYATYWLPGHEPSTVLGAIEAWGPTVVGEDAFRARHARLVALCMPMTPYWAGVITDEYLLAQGARLRKLGNQYRVPVFTSADEFKAAHPVSDVTSLLPPKPVSLLAALDDVRKLAAATKALTNYNSGGSVTTTGIVAGAPVSRPFSCWCGTPDCPYREPTQVTTKSHPEPAANPFIDPVY